MLFNIERTILCRNWGVSIEFTNKFQWCVGMIFFSKYNKIVNKKYIIFFYKLQVLNDTLSIERNSNATLMLRPTIPIVLETIETSSSQVTSQIDVELSFPGSTGMSCQSQSSFRQCKVTIKSFLYNDRQLYENPSNWYNVTSMLIHNYDQHKYDLAGPKLVLRLKTSNTNGEGTKIYGNVTLHDVQVRQRMLWYMYIFRRKVSCNSCKTMLNAQVIYKRKYWYWIIRWYNWYTSIKNSIKINELRYSKFNLIFYLLTYY